ncbi:MAG: hypothetical protein FD180_706 [Planctomycetota bacterium]|nr:MAG: hypothetical protein FD180_706 [Planctomycetota bacterium]
MKPFASAVLLVLAMTASSRAEDPQGISEAAGKARATHLAQVIAKWETDTGKQVVYDLAGFWKKMGPKATWQNMARYIKLEDGVEEPLRTGREVALYDRIKEFTTTRKEGETLGMDKLLVLALESAEIVEETVNFQAVTLTLHNVVRLIARPLQWAGPQDEGNFGHPASDPASPVLDDLRGLAATKGRTFADICAIKKKTDGEVIDLQWPLTVLFDLKTGIFQPQPGARETLWNGGCHYYYWVGALGHATLGSVAVMGGLTKELSAKKAMGDGEQGIVQVSCFVAGSMFGAEAYSKRDGLLGWFDGRWKGTATMKWDDKSVEVPLLLEITAEETGFSICALEPETLKRMPNKENETTKFSVRKEGEGDEQKLFLEASNDKDVLKLRLEKPGTLNVEGWQTKTPDRKVMGALKRLANSK